MEPKLIKRGLLLETWEENGETWKEPNLLLTIIMLISVILGYVTIISELIKIIIKDIT